MLDENARKVRSAYIEKMEQSVANMSVGSMPLWFSSLFVAILFVGATLYMVVIFIINALADLIKLPFQYAFVFADMVALLVWYSKRIALKMSGRE